jgi:ribosomal protein S18 acetylase RimI-like enzyme
MMRIKIRPIAIQDIASLLEMSPYSKYKRNQLGSEEEILVAQSGRKILGAISISNKNISFIYGDWKDEYNQCLGSLLKEVSGSWISKLYVFPEYRHQGIGTKLVRKALKSLELKDATEVYAGIYVENEFREISIRIFDNNGFVKIGSCLCPLANGYCRGTLIRKTFVPNS